MDRVIFSVGNGEERIHIAVRHLGVRVHRQRFDICRRLQGVETAVLLKVEGIEGQLTAAQRYLPVPVRHRRAVKHQRRRVQDAVERRLVDCAADIAVEYPMPLDRVRQILGDARQVDIVHRHMKVERSVSGKDGPVKIHIHARRKNMKIMQRQHAVFHRVIAVHPGQ